MSEMENLKKRAAIAATGLLGLVLFVCGAFIIHKGLGVMAIGAWAYWIAKHW